MELIYTNDLCTGCNKCVRGLSCTYGKYCNAGRLCNGRPGQMYCMWGNVLMFCPHEARDYYDDTDRFFEDLASGKKISVILAPAFLANYPKEYQRVLGYLKSKGVNHICSVSFGADITTWGYLKIHWNTNFSGHFQPCPAVVTYVENIYRSWIPRLDAGKHSPDDVYCYLYEKIHAGHR